MTGTTGSVINGTIRTGITIAITIAASTIAIVTIAIAVTTGTVAIGGAVDSGYIGATRKTSGAYGCGSQSGDGNRGRPGG
jgi:hypothetical protein